MRRGGGWVGVAEIELMTERQASEREKTRKQVGDKRESSGDGGDREK